MELAGLAAVIVIALLFDFTNGFHDAANAIATSVTTRALRPRTALVLAGLLNICGAFLGTGVAETVGAGVISVPENDHGLVVVFAALAGAIAWNLVTWRLGLPSSSSHALIGGMVGAALASSDRVTWPGVVEKVVVPMALSPILGLLLGYGVMALLLWLFRRARPRRATRGFRYAQTVSAAGMALSHGLQDAQKTMGLIVLALVTTGHREGFTVPTWVIFAAATSMGLGTYVGGWRIIATLGRRVTRLDPAHGFAAETSAATVLAVTALMFRAPVSTTHVITSAIMGSGATTRLSAVRWGVAGNIATAWVLTFPGAGLAAMAAYWVVAPLAGP